jgi:hypothetical protein
MRDWKMYMGIQKLKALCFKKASTSRKFEIDFRTVKKYWDISAQKFEL